MKRALISRHPDLWRSDPGLYVIERANKIYVTRVSDSKVLILEYRQNPYGFTNAVADVIDIHTRKRRVILNAMETGGIITL